MNIKFILDESAFQGLSIGIIFFIGISFCKVVQKLLKTKNLNLVVKCLDAAFCF